MVLSSVLAIALGLSMDAVSVAIAASVRLRGVSRRQVFRFAWHFGLFQAMMPFIGWAAGRSISQHIQSWDHWVAMGLLTAVGLKALYESLRGGDEFEPLVTDPTRGYSLVMLSIATSIDALAVGLSFAFLEMDVWYPCLVIGIVTAALTALGMVFGSRLGRFFGPGAEILGGLVLIGIGVKIVLEHTL